MTTSAAQWTLTPLLNVQVDAETVLDPTLRIRRVSDDERARWQADETVQRVTDPTELCALTHVIEQTASEASPALSDMSEPGEQFFALMGIIELLLFDIYDRLRTPVIEYGVPARGWAPKVYEMPGALKRYQQQISTPSRIASAHILTAWGTLDARSPASLRIRRALGRATRARAEYFAEDVILEAAIGLECLFSPRNNRNIGNTIAGASIEWCLDATASYETSALVDAFKQQKQVYDIRSAIVHGNEITRADLSDHAKAILKRLRNCVRYAVLEGSDGLDGRMLLTRFGSRLPPDVIETLHLFGRNGNAHHNGDSRAVRPA